MEPLATWRRIESGFLQTHSESPTAAKILSFINHVHVWVSANGLVHAGCHPIMPSCYPKTPFLPRFGLKFPFSNYPPHLETHTCTACVIISLFVCGNWMSPEASFPGDPGTTPWPTILYDFCELFWALGSQAYSASLPGALWDLSCET